jgi:glycosyltransferase involved in cell wall biosynthesis
VAGTEPDPSPKAPISTVILTSNEELNLGACLDSVAPWVGEIFIVDSGSTDRTIEIAGGRGAKVVTHEFETHAKQWNWALRNLPLSHDWALCLDADHRATPELADEVISLFRPDRSKTAGRRDRVHSPADVDGFYVKRRQVFRDRWIRHGGYYPKYLLKLVRHDRAWCDENELLDARFYVKGTTASLDGDLIEDNRNETDILFWVAKHTRYALLQAREELHRAHHDTGWAVTPSPFGTPDQRTLWLKHRWYRMPLLVRPFLYFFYRYVLRLGFLDGKEGFIFHFLQGFWYRLLVDIKLDELRRQQRASAAGDAAGGLDR